MEKHKYQQIKHLRRVESKRMKFLMSFKKIFFKEFKLNYPMRPLYSYKEKLWKGEQKEHGQRIFEW